MSVDSPLGDPMLDAMQVSLRGLSTAFASFVLACTPRPSVPPSPSAPSDPASRADRLAAESKLANDALMRGDIQRYASLLHIADDFTLMSPFGGQPRTGGLTPARMEDLGRFFKNGSLEQELVHAYATPDMVVLAIIERAAHVEVGELPAQDWALRVTLVYRREGSEWHLVHRHADPLAHPISVTESAALARGEPVRNR